MEVYHTLKPIYDKYSKILILGSMPSVKSREEGFYYAHSSNRFWHIFENIFQEKLTSIDDKKAFLKKHNIALWDVFAKVDINGSSDSSIKDAKKNDLSIILSKCKIKAIFCTGKTAFNNLMKDYSYDIPTFYLPSPSSANAAFSLDYLIDSYKIVLDYLR